MNFGQWLGGGRGRGQGSCGNGHRRGQGRRRQRAKDAGLDRQIRFGRPAAEQIGTDQFRSEHLPTMHRMLAMVDESQCAGCGLCMDACAEHAISVNSFATVDPDMCTGCGACVPVCPNESLWLAHTSAK